MSQVPFVVLRSNDYCFLGILRSCAAANIPTIPVIFDWPESPDWLSENSIHFNNPQTIANPFANEAQALKDLIKIGEELYSKYNERLFLIPSSDTNLMFIQNNFVVLSKYFKQMGHQLFEQDILDLIKKDSCFELLGQHSQAVPVTYSCRNLTDIDPILENMTYPCIYKPAEKDYGQQFYAKHSGNKAITCESSEILKESLIKECQNNFALVVQEKIKFSSYMDEIPVYLYADKNSNIKMFSSAVKTHIHPHPFGTAVELEMSNHNELLSLSQEIISSLKYRGIAMIEFIKDEKDFQWKVIEINFRPWLFVDFYRRFGLNYLEQLKLDISNKLQKETIYLSDKFNAKPPYHINLSYTLKAFKDKDPSFRFNNLKELVLTKSKKYSLSFSYYDPKDPKPFETFLLKLSNDFNKNEVYELVKTYGEF